MTHVRRPIHLQLGQLGQHQPQQQHPLPSPRQFPNTGSPFNTNNNVAATPQTPSSKAALTPTSADALPSQILPHLFVGNQEQTNRETLNRLNISYILSLGLMPLVCGNCTSPNSPATTPTAVCNNNNNNNNIISNNTSNQHSPLHQSSPRMQQYHTQQQQQQQRAGCNSNAQQHHQQLPKHNSSIDFKIRLRVTGASNEPRSASKEAAGRHENRGVRPVRSIHCKCINVADSQEQSLARFFDEAHQFIDEARRKRCNVLVHCFAGISRSPTFAIAYLMRVNSLRLQDAYELVKQCRPQIDPNLSFMGQLMMYEKSLEVSNHNNSNKKNNNK